MPESPLLFSQISDKAPQPPQQDTPLKFTPLSPVMAQYCELKEQHSDSLLFFRLGDFYELFFDDAVIAARDMDVALTKRGKKEGEDIPMCGIPVHTYETYLAKLIQKGHKVAICDQVEDPEQAKQRGHKGPLRREVTRVVTPGTLTEDPLLSPRHHNFLIALSPLTRSDIGVAVADLSTGTFFVESTDDRYLSSVLARLNPAEIVVPDVLLTHPPLFECWAGWRSRLSPLPEARFDGENCRRRLEDTYVVKTLDAFGSFSKAEIRAAGALIDYLSLTQKQALPRMDRPRKLCRDDFMIIDPATRRSLELTLTQQGQKKGSLLDTMDHTLTASGARMLSVFLSSPLTHVVQIQERLDSVEVFLSEKDLTQGVQSSLADMPDMERSLSRLSLGRGNPRDLGAIRDGLLKTYHLKAQLNGHDLPPLLTRLTDELGQFDSLIDELSRALGPQLPFHTKDGHFIAENYHSELDSLRYFRDHSQELMEQLQEQYIKDTGISSLKIKHNHIIGYHIDVGSAHASKVPETFIHRQTLASSLRYTTKELAEIERKRVSVDQQIATLETTLFAFLVSLIQDQSAALLASCRSLATLDVLLSFATVAKKNQYVRPVVDESLAFVVHQGIHPVVFSALKEKEGSVFVSNPCSFEDGIQLQLITGPNMAGKSTYLRQNALMAILAQMGSFVPASFAHIGIVDRVFSRVGASDDLAAGRSTFMVEMVETATILHQATSRSFVILDEIGRGTATYDGLSLAWAVSEALIKTNGCRTLFATHYHELTSLAQSYPQVACRTMKIEEWEDQLIFLHQIVPGTAKGSYGLHVARLAGIPPQVIQRASQILQTLDPACGSLLSFPTPSPEPQQSSPSVSALESYLQTVNPDALSPKEALEILYELKSKL